MSAAPPRVAAREFVVGRARIVKVPELDLNGFPFTRLLPGLDPDTVRRHPAWAPPGTYDPATGHALMSVHTWVVRHAGRVLLVDTGAGNGKARPTMPVLDHLRQPYLERLAAVGVRPADVDYVLLTHVHADHVGWNTTRADGAEADAPGVWTPTFPNATVVCSALEWRYAAALAAGDAAGAQSALDQAGLGAPVRTPVPGVFDDSMRPLEAAGRLRLVAVDGREALSDILPGVRFLPAAGHSIDHAAIELTSGGETALFGGDVLHHPLEVYAPALVSMFCEFPDASRRARLALLERAAATRALYCSSHFPLSSAGRVQRRGAGYAWSFA